MEISKIKDRNDLERRGASIVNTNKDGFLQFLATREKAMSDAQRISNLENELKQLSDIVAKLVNRENMK